MIMWGDDGEVGVAFYWVVLHKIYEERSYIEHNGKMKEK